MKQVIYMDIFIWTSLIINSPNKFRVNAVLPQFQKFYDTYGITENDGMYVKPEDRLGIW